MPRPTHCTLPSGGTIKDAAGNDATLTLPATGTDGLASQAHRHRHDGADGNRGILDGHGFLRHRSDYSDHDHLRRADDGHRHAATDAERGSGAVANYVSGSGTDTLTFNYVVAAGQITHDLDYASTDAP